MHRSENGVDVAEESVPPKFKPNTVSPASVETGKLKGDDAESTGASKLKRGC
jgi:hypothetical protein